MHTLRKDTASKTHFWIAVIQVLVLALLALALKPAEAKTDPRTGTLACASEGGWGLTITSGKELQRGFS